MNATTALPSDRPTVSFVVPCYNEEKNLAATIEEIETAARKACSPSYEIVVVDDCSSDSTGDVADALATHDPRIKVVRNPKNLGFGGAYKVGVSRALGTYLIMVPGDNAHPHQGISPILHKLGEADIIIPYANNPEARSLGRRFVSRAFTILMNSLFRLDLPYFNGLVLHRTDLLRKIEIRTNGFAYQAEALVKLILAGATYATVAVEITERNHGRSTALRLRNLLRVVKTIMMLLREVRRPSEVAVRTPDDSVTSAADPR